MSEKLKVMKYNQLMMTALGVCPKSFAASSPSLRWLHTLSPPFMAFFLIVSVGSAGRFILEGSTRLSFICEALIVLIGGIQSFLAFVNMLRKINIIGRMYLRLQEIVDHAMEQKAVASIYWTAERKGRQFTERMGGFVLSEQFSFAFALLFSIVCVCVGNYDISTYYLPLRMKPPFIVDTVYRWYWFWGLQFFASIGYMAGMITAALYFVCGCFYLVGFCDHFEYLIKLVDAEFSLNRGSLRERTLNARKLLSNTIDHHNRIYEIFDMLTDVNSGTVFAFLALSSPYLGIFTYLGISLYNLENSDSGMSSERIAITLFAIFCVSCAMMWAFLVCHYGTYTTERVRSIDLTVYNANWLNYPHDLQRYIILIIVQSRSKINFNGLGMIGCDLEVFSKICRSSCSYYLIFRSFTQR